MASIVENFIGDRAIQLGNEEFVRKLSFTNNWTYLRVGIYFRLLGKASTAHPSRLQIGLNNGDQNTFTSNNCAGYAGTAKGYFSNSEFIYDSTNRRFSHSLYTNWLIKKVGATITDTTVASVNNIGYLASADSAAPSIFTAGFLKTGSGAYTVSGTYMNAANFAIRPSYYNFLQVMDDETDETYISVGNALAMTGLGNLDTVSIFWSKNVPVVEIYSLIAVAYW